MKGRYLSKLPVACLTATSLHTMVSQSVPTASAFAPAAAPAAQQASRLFSSDPNDDTVITPRDPNTLFNFGPASRRDEKIFTCERPGGDPEGGETIGAEVVSEWAKFMHQKEIEGVLVLVDDNELEIYEEPGLVKMYEAEGFEVIRNPMGEVGASTRAMETVSKFAKDKKKIVAHCTHGQGRAGRVAAAWLTHEYNLSPEEATSEALDTASEHGVTRLGSATKLKQWLENV